MGIRHSRATTIITAAEPSAAPVTPGQAAAGWTGSWTQRFRMDGASTGDESGQPLPATTPDICPASQSMSESR